MTSLHKYVEWLNRGRRTNRIAYVLKEWDLPIPLPGAEWQLDVKFNAAEEILANPRMKDFLGKALKERVAVVNLSET